MAFKINIAHKGKTYKVESEDEILVGKSIGDTFKGEEVSPDLTGYELEITGTSDKSGFPGLPELTGPQLKKALLTYGRGMKQRPRKEGKKKTPNTQGLRLRKTVRGKEISEATVQINIKVTKEGTKKFEDFFKTEEAPAEEAKPAEEKVEEKKE
jgi:small subunit ribosomal protein S6e